MLFAGLLETKAVTGMVADRAGDENPARFGSLLETRSNVDAVSEDVALLRDDVAHMDPDTESHLPVSHSAFPLDFRRKLDRLDGAGKFRQKPVAHGFDDAPPLPFSFGLDHLAEEGLNARKGPFLVGAHEAGIAGDIGAYDGQKAAVGRIHAAFGAPAAAG